MIIFYSGVPFEQEEQAGHLDSELATVISSIALACKQIASLVTRSGISNLTGAAGAANFSVRVPITQQSRLASLIFMPSPVETCKLTLCHHMQLCTTQKMSGVYSRLAATQMLCHVG